MGTLYKKLQRGGRTNISKVGTKRHYGSNKQDRKNPYLKETGNKPVRAKTKINSGLKSRTQVREYVKPAPEPEPITYSRPRNFVRTGGRRPSEMSDYDKKFIGTDEYKKKFTKKQGGGTLYGKLRDGGYTKLNTGGAYDYDQGGAGGYQEKTTMGYAGSAAAEGFKSGQAESGNIVYAAGKGLVRGVLGAIGAGTEKRNLRLNRQEYKDAERERSEKIKLEQDKVNLDLSQDGSEIQSVDYYRREGGSMPTHGLGKASGGNLKKLSSNASLVKGNKPNKVDDVVFKDQKIALDHDEVVVNDFVHSEDFGYADEVAKLQKEKGNLEKNGSLKSRMRIKEIDRMTEAYAQKQEAEKAKGKAKNKNMRCGGKLHKSVKY
jgi:hypothetical protein